MLHEVVNNLRKKSAFLTGHTGRAVSKLNQYLSFMPQEQREERSAERAAEGRMRSERRRWW